MATEEIMTITVSSILVLLAIITPLCNGLFRNPLRKKKSGCTKDGAASPLSIILTVHDQGYELERNLPILLSQKYDAGFEVIVVDESSTDNTDDVLTLLKSQYPNLYTTFIPESSHYLSRRKLALTIGIKAARNEWLFLTDADCHPESDRWLEAMSRHCNDGTDIVLGYSNYEPQTNSFYRFERLLTSCLFMRKAQKGMAYRYDGSNLAVRKSVFMSHNGFVKNLKYLRGEYDFLVNEYAQPGRTAIATEPETFMRQDKPATKTWVNSHLYYMETRKHLKRSASYRLPFNLNMGLMYVNYILIISALIHSLYSSDIILTAASALSLIITLAMRTMIACRTAAGFGEKLPYALIPLMELRILWQNAWFMLRHRRSDKYDFIRR
ncbi:MAG: glycosyltransferase [Prevotella sp.]|nr:glycosyltransferase [Prevotella sp.]